MPFYLELFANNQCSKAVEKAVQLHSRCQKDHQWAGLTNSQGPWGSWESHKGRRRAQEPSDVDLKNERVRDEDESLECERVHLLVSADSDSTRASVVESPLDTTKLPLQIHLPPLHETIIFRLSRSRYSLCLALVLSVYPLTATTFSAASMYSQKMIQ